MEILPHRQDCCGCHACLNACPAGAIAMEYDAEGFLYPVIQEAACIHCQKCQQVCPVLHPSTPETGVTVYAARATDPEERLTSSSGGVFGTFARLVLQKGGLVCGAAYDKDLAVGHILISQTEDLPRLKGTKYVQSAIGIVYAQVRTALQNDRTVLFSGTPCQVAGLKTYLGREYEGLLTIDLICHGVPSPLVWQDYLRQLGGDRPVQSVNHREKDPATGQERVCMQFSDGSTQWEEKNQNVYLKGFLQNLYLRPSCFSCRFKGLHRCSDLTIGDFWSIREFHPQMADGFGVNALLVHSEKGRSWLRQADAALTLCSATADQAATWNECLLTPVRSTPKRQTFYDQWHRQPLVPLIEDLTAPQPQKSSLLSRLRKRLWPSC